MPRAAATPTSGPPDPATLSYEQARDELVAVVTRLEAGGATLEESLTLWERGEALAARCQEWLDGARRRLDAARTDDGAGAPDARTKPTTHAGTSKAGGDAKADTGDTDAAPAEDDTQEES